VKTTAQHFWLVAGFAIQGDESVFDRPSSRPQLLDDADLVVRYVAKDVGNAQQNEKGDDGASPERGVGPAVNQTIDVHVTSPMPAIDPSNGSFCDSQRLQGCRCGCGQLVVQGANNVRDGIINIASRNGGRGVKQSESLESMTNQ
jgi:hypothetical protein